MGKCALFRFPISSHFLDIQFASDIVVNLSRFAVYEFDRLLEIEWCNLSYEPNSQQNHFYMFENKKSLSIQHTNQLYQREIPCRTMCICTDYIVVPKKKKITIKSICHKNGINWLENVTTLVELFIYNFDRKMCHQRIFFSVFLLWFFLFDVFRPDPCVAMQKKNMNELTNPINSDSQLSTNQICKSQLNWTFFLLIILI